MPSCAAQRRLRDLAEVGPVDRDPALARVVEAREQLRDGRLARARVADERDGRPRRDVEVEVVEDVRQLSVAEADVLEADVAPDRGQLTCVGRIDDLRLLVEHRRDPVERRRGGEERVVELRELLHRVEEVRQVEREGEQGADRHAPVDDEPSADPEDDRGRDRREDVDRREVEPVQDHGLVVGLAVALVDAAKGRLTRRLSSERLDDAHA